MRLVWTIVVSLFLPSTVAAPSSGCGLASSQQVAELHFLNRLRLDPAWYFVQSAENQSACGDAVCSNTTKFSPNATCVVALACKDPANRNGERIPAGLTRFPWDSYACGHSWKQDEASLLHTSMLIVVAVMALCLQVKSQQCARPWLFGLAWLVYGVCLTVAVLEAKYTTFLWPAWLGSISICLARIAAWTLAIVSAPEPFSSPTSVATWLTIEAFLVFWPPFLIDFSTFVLSLVVFSACLSWMLQLVIQGQTSSWHTLALVVLSLMWTVQVEPWRTFLGILVAHLSALLCAWRLECIAQEDRGQIRPRTFSDLSFGGCALQLAALCLVLISHKYLAVARLLALCGQCVSLASLYFYVDG